MPDFQMGANRVEDLLISLDLDALVVFNGINLRYLCGFTGNYGQEVTDDVAEGSAERCCATQSAAGCCLQ
jgi:hypothetical protein